MSVGNGPNKWVLLGVLALGLGLGAVSYFMGFGGSPNPGKNAITLREAPPFQLKDRSGKSFQLKDFEGKLVLLHFWAQWCAPCIDEIPKWAAVGEKFKGRPLQMVAISLDEKWEDAEKVLTPAMLSSQLISLLDAESKVADRYGSYQYPETYLLTPKGKILVKWVGGQDWQGASIVDMIDQALGAVEGIKAK